MMMLFETMGSSKLRSISWFKSCWEINLENRKTDSIEANRATKNEEFVGIFLVDS